MSTHSHTPTPPRTPLGPARLLPPSIPRTKSNGTLARQFVDRHSTTYAHLYEHEDDVVRREKLDAEQRKLEEERRRGREMRERMAQSLAGVENENDVALRSAPLPSAFGKGLPGSLGGNGRGSWRPLSLVAKRQNVGPGHARSASHQIPSTLLSPSSLRSVSHTPVHSSPFAQNPTPASTSSDLEVVVERSTPNSPNRSLSQQGPEHAYYNAESHEGDISHKSDPKSTYSWATSFSGETAELRATATYLRQSHDERDSAASTPPSHDHADAAQAVDDEVEILDTPEKVKRRRKRIVAIAHTVRQLEGVGSRQAEDPNFYGELVKAWNDRPGFQPTHAPLLAPAHGGSSDAPPGVLPPPNLHSVSKAQRRYSAHSLAAPPPMSPTFERHFGSPLTPNLFTPATNYEGGTAPSSSVFPSPQEVYEYDDEESDESVGHVRTRSRYSYASALHDLALEDGGHEVGQGKTGMSKAWSNTPMRWSGAWEGWDAYPALPPGAAPAQMPSGADEEDEAQAIDGRNHQHLQSTSQYQPQLPLSRPPLDTSLYPPPLSGVPDGRTSAETDNGWGLGFMSGWWTERPLSSRNLSNPSNPPAPLPSPPSQSRDTAGREADFQGGECASRQSPNLHALTQLHQHSGPDREEAGEITSTPGHHQPRQHHDTSFSPSADSESLSGVSTPSFGMRVQASAERRWARPTVIQTGQNRTRNSETPLQPTHRSEHPSWLVSIPMETTSSATSLESYHPHLQTRPALPTIDSTSSNLTSTTVTTAKGEEREFPFSNHCRPPSCSNIPSSAESSVSVPSEIHLLRAEVALSRMNGEEQEWLREGKAGDQYSGGLVNGSFPFTRTLRPMMFRQSQAEESKVEQMGREEKDQSLGLLERRHVRPLMLGEMLNPMSTSTPSGDGTAPKLHIELQSSTSQHHTRMINSNPSLAPTPTSIQTHFIPPPTTPVLPLTPTTPSDTTPSMMSDVDAQSRQIFYRTADERVILANPPRRAIFPSASILTPAPVPDQNYDHSSFPCDSNVPNGDTLPARSDLDRARTGMLDLRGQAISCQSTGRSAAVETEEMTDEVLGECRGGYRDATPLEVAVVAHQPKRRGWSPVVLFWLGFIMPWCWIFGGWPVWSGREVKTVVGDVDVEKGGLDAEVERSWLRRWVYHPDPWARRNRMAAVGVLPLLAVAGVVGVIVLGVMRAT